MPIRVTIEVRADDTEEAEELANPLSLIMTLLVMLRVPHGVVSTLPPLRPEDDDPGNGATRPPRARGRAGVGTRGGG